MINKLSFSIFIFITSVSLGQTKLQVTNSEIKFYSKAPLENIEATSKESKGIVDNNNKTFIIKIPIVSFEFSSELMKEHFNENYMESSKFPYAIFKGTINKTINTTQNGSQNIISTGNMTIHGVTQNVSIPLTININNSNITFSGTTKVALKDYNITIPTLVIKKIAEVVDISIKGNLKPL